MMVVLDVITCAKMCSIVVVPLVRVPIVHTPFEVLYDPLLSSDMYCSPVGSMSVDVTTVALCGPLLCIIMV